MKKYEGKSIKELEDMWHKLIEECYNIRREIDRRQSNIPSVDVDFTNYITK